MASRLTWLDYSEGDRRRALEVIDLFRETGTVDELGLAGIRDSYSELFFPGTSTIQTRACYFLLVPWTFKRLERRGWSSSKIGERARQAELNLNRRLRTGDDTRGVFGSQAGDDLKRLPSEVYWGGLGSWGIRRFRGHMWAYFRSLDGFYRRAKELRSVPRESEGRRAPPTNWDPHLPEPPKGFPYENVSVALRREDAAYLRDCIQVRHPESLLAVLAGRTDPEDLEPVYPWELPWLDEIADRLRNRLRDAELFAVSMQGAALLYNLMLSEKQHILSKKREHEKRIEHYRGKLEEWAADAAALGTRLADWRLEDVWRVVWDARRRLSHPTRAFIEGWVEQLKQHGPEAIVDEKSEARTLVRDREMQLKGGRARLESLKHLELWGGSSGTGRLDYRWGITKKFLRDIFDGLERSEGDARDA